jgi:hypothetical protein
VVVGVCVGGCVGGWGGGGGGAGARAPARRPGAGEERSGAEGKSGVERSGRERRGSPSIIAGHPRALLVLMLVQQAEEVAMLFGTFLDGPVQSFLRALPSNANASTAVANLPARHTARPAMAQSPEGI